MVLIHLAQPLDSVECSGPSSDDDNSLLRTRGTLNLGGTLVLLNSLGICSHVDVRALDFDLETLQIIRSRRILDVACRDSQLTYAYVKALYAHPSLR